MLRHIGIQIIDKSEIEDFYVNILNFKIERRFFIHAQTAKEIYGTDKQIEVCRVKQFNLVIDLIISDEPFSFGFHHVALEFWKADEIIDKAREASYPVYVFSKTADSMARYIKDKSGNLFELKDINLI